MEKISNRSVLTKTRRPSKEYIDFHMFETVNNLGLEREREKKKGEVRYQKEVG